MPHANNIISSPVGMLADLQSLLGCTGGLGSIIRYANINRWARYKPFRHSAIKFATDSARDEARAAARMGFGTTPSIVYTSSGDLGHALLTYDRPRGAVNSEPFRTLDFKGYRHNAVSPVDHVFPPVLYATGGAFGVLVAFNPSSKGYSAQDCVTIGEIVDGNTKEMFIGLLFVRQDGGDTFLVSSSVKVKDYSSPFYIQVSGDGTGGSVTASSLAGAIGKTYTIAVVATTNGNGLYSRSQMATPKSLELGEGEDRAVRVVRDWYDIAGITGIITSIPYTVLPDPDSSWKAVSFGEIVASLTTPSSWHRSNAYIDIEFTNYGGYIYQNGVQIGGQIHLGAYVRLQTASTTESKVIVSAADAGDYQFWAPKPGWGGSVVHVAMRAYKNSEMSGEGELLEEKVILLQGS